MTQTAQQMRTEVRDKAIKVARAEYRKQVKQAEETRDGAVAVAWAKFLQSESAPDK